MEKYINEIIFPPAMSEKKILYVASTYYHDSVLESMLKNEGLGVQNAMSAGEAIQRVDSETFSLILTYLFLRPGENSGHPSLEELSTKEVPDRIFESTLYLIGYTRTKSEFNRETPILVYANDLDDLRVSEASERIAKAGADKLFKVMQNPSLPAESVYGELVNAIISKKSDL